MYSQTVTVGITHEASMQKEPRSLPDEDNSRWDPNVDSLGFFFSFFGGGVINRIEPI